MNVELTIVCGSNKRSMVVKGIPNMEYLWELIESIESNGNKTVSEVDILGY